MSRIPAFFYCFILACFLASASTFAQTQYAFRVSFTGKNGTSGTLGAPSAYLSARALDRRDQQSIAIDSADLPLSRAYIDTVLSLSSGVLHTRSKWQNNCVVLMPDTSSMHLVRSKPYVKSAVYVAVFSAPLHLLKANPSDKNTLPESAVKDRLRTTGTVGYYGDAFDQIRLANGDYLHDRGYRGKGKLIAVLDEGFNLVNTLPGFDSLRSSGRITDTYNFNLNKAEVYGYSAHGTQVLSTMAGILNGSYVGTAPDADYALYVTENSSAEQPFEMDNLVAAMERADSIGADIITISLGYNTFTIGTLNADLKLTDIDGKSTIAAMGTNTATQKGILVVASAGNEGGGWWNKILTPGDADSALTCGSVDISKAASPTSGRGPNAAGVRKPDVCMLGAPGIVLNSSGTTSSVSGTSIATPELAGLAACLWQAYPKANPYQLRKAIRESAHIASAPNNEQGYGVPDFGKATLSLAETPCICAEPGLTVYPNPFTDALSVEINGANSNETLQWSLYNMQGQKILSAARPYTAGSFYFTIPTPQNLPSGIYILRVNSGQYNQTFKLQK
ncbi:MAG: S8 family peptidase [Chitinophagaceae bacterium]|nr:S8 family peptidase [Chitinophagaceae bacterium]